MKYYLLTFNDDYGDEHNVPALACFNEDEYKKWAESESGELNLKYDEEMKVYEANVARQQKFRDECLARGIWNMPVGGYTSEEKKWIAENTYSVPYNSYPKKVKSEMYAFLGNGGDYFDENYQNLHLMEEFVTAKLVEVTEVDESFYNYFKKARLDNLSLCNVFETPKG